MLQGGYNRSCSHLGLRNQRVKFINNLTLNGRPRLLDWSCKFDGFTTFWSSAGARAPSNEIHNTRVMNRIVNALFFLSLTQISPPDLPGPCRMNIIGDKSMPTAFKQYFSATRKCVRCVILALLCICRNSEIAECSGRAISGHNRGVAIIGDCM